MPPQGQPFTIDALQFDEIIILLNQGVFLLQVIAIVLSVFLGVYGFRLVLLFKNQSKFF